VLPSHVAPSQVHKSGDRLGNHSGDVGGEIAIRWKNGVWTLQWRYFKYLYGVCRNICLAIL